MRIIHKKNPFKPFYIKMKNISLLVSSYLPRLFLYRDIVFDCPVYIFLTFLSVWTKTLVCKNYYRKM